MPDNKKMVSFMEDTEIVNQIDAVALREGSDRSAIVRRAIRKELLFLQQIPTSGLHPVHSKPSKEAA